MPVFTTYGAVRLGCGHRHKSVAAAERCLTRDRDGCASQRGYSDRSIYTVDEDGYLIDLDGAPLYPPSGRSSGAVRLRP